jgi:hypothetical protein
MIIIFFSTHSFPNKILFEFDPNFLYFHKFTLIPTFFLFLNFLVRLNFNLSFSTFHSIMFNIKKYIIALKFSMLHNHLIMFTIS